MFLKNFNVKNKTALVTGSGKGIGKACAIALAEAGANVIILSRTEKDLLIVQNKIKKLKKKCSYYVCDVTNLKEIKKIFSEINKLDILVNNAGIPDAQWAVKQSEELIDNVMETNLTGPYILSCEVARKLIEEKKPGRMVNIASVAAFNTTPQSAASLYSITKKAVVRMTEALAVEWSKSYINVNAIAPGAFSSEMLDGMIERVGDFSQAFPRKRICTPEQMDSTLLFLVSPSSECVTGTCIKIDDGQGPR